MGGKCASLPLHSGGPSRRGRHRRPNEATTLLSLDQASATVQVPRSRCPDFDPEWLRKMMTMTDDDDDDYDDDDDDDDDYDDA